jgi:flagellar biosynthesis GTPase FlhF
LINPNQLLNSLDNTVNQKLIAEVASLKDMIMDVSDNIKYKYTGTMPETLARIYKIMIDSDFNEDVCLDIIGKIATKGLSNDYHSAMEEARKQILSNITYFEPVIDNTNNDNCYAELVSASPDTNKETPKQVRCDKKIITFIGSSGCGKTTSLIKLGIATKLLKQAKVLIISTDTFRVGAAEQLQLLTGIAGITFMLAYNSDEIKKILNEQTKYDLVLIDTMGRNPNNRDEINELLDIQNAINTMQTPFTKCFTFLVLSAVSSASALDNNIKRFSDFNVDSAVITRTDEAFGLGNVITALNKKQIPISYFTNGQKIPDDIEQANNERLNDYLFCLN